jgi:hypothetical protein
MKNKDFLKNRFLTIQAKKCLFIGRKSGIHIPVSIQ